MAEYIDREAAMRAVQGQRGPCRSPAQNRMLDYLKAAIARIPAADVEQVIRCKDCKHYDLGVCLKIYQDGNLHSEAWQPRKPEDFCSYGERKDGADAER